MCRSSAAMPTVANGVRTRAWNASTLAPPSGKGGGSGQRADLRQQLRRDGDAVPVRAVAVGAAPIARQAHAVVLAHRRHQRLDALEEDVAAGERARIDGQERLADARGPAFLDEEAVRLEAERRA